MNNKSTFVFCFRAEISRYLRNAALGTQPPGFTEQEKNNFEKIYMNHILSQLGLIDFQS